MNANNIDMADVIKVTAAFETISRKLIKKGFVDKVTSIKVPFGTKIRTLKPIFDSPKPNRHGNIEARIGVGDRKFVCWFVEINRMGVRLTDHSDWRKHYKFARTSFGRAVNNIMLRVTPQHEKVLEMEWDPSVNRVIEKEKTIFNEGGTLENLISSWYYSVKYPVDQRLTKWRRDEMNRKTEALSKRVEKLSDPEWSFTFCGVGMVGNPSISTKEVPDGSGKLVHRLLLHQRPQITLRANSQRTMNAILDLIDRHIEEYDLEVPDKVLGNNPVMKGHSNER